MKTVHIHFYCRCYAGFRVLRTHVHAYLETELLLNHSKMKLRYKSNSKCKLRHRPIKNLRHGVPSAKAFNISTFQISSVSKSCYYHIRQLRCIRPYLDTETASTIATSIIHCSGRNKKNIRAGVQHEKYNNEIQKC